MVTSLAEGEAVCGLISWLVALVCRAISPSLSVVLTWCHALTGQIKPYGGKSVRFGSTNSQQVPQRCLRLVSVEPPYRSGICLYQASGIEKYCLANVCFGLDSSMVFTWEALTLHLENNEGKGGLLWERDTMRQDSCAADFILLYNSTVFNNSVDVFYNFTVIKLKWIIIVSKDRLDSVSTCPTIKHTCLWPGHIRFPFKFHKEGH